MKAEKIHQGETEQINQASDKLSRNQLIFLIDELRAQVYVVTNLHIFLIDDLKHKFMWSQNGQVVGHLTKHFNNPSFFRD